jgi:hypothetical protein
LLSKYLCSQHGGGQHGFGQHGLGSQQRGLGGQQGSQHESRSQQQLAKERATAAKKPKFNNFLFIQNTPVEFIEFKDFN